MNIKFIKAKSNRKIGWMGVEFTSVDPLKGKVSVFDVAAAMSKEGREKGLRVGIDWIQVGPNLYINGEGNFGIINSLLLDISSRNEFGIDSFKYKSLTAQEENYFTLKNQPSSPSSSTESTSSQSSTTNNWIDVILTPYDEKKGISYASIIKDLTANKFVPGESFDFDYINNAFSLNVNSVRYRDIKEKFQKYSNNININVGTVNIQEQEDDSAFASDWIVTTITPLNKNLPVNYEKIILDLSTGDYIRGTDYGFNNTTDIFYLNKNSERYGEIKDIFLNTYQKNKRFNAGTVVVEEENSEKKWTGGMWIPIEIFPLQKNQPIKYKEIISSLKSTKFISGKDYDITNDNIFYINMNSENYEIVKNFFLKVCNNREDYNTGLISIDEDSTFSTDDIRKPKWVRVLFSINDLSRPIDYEAMKIDLKTRFNEGEDFTITDRGLRINTTSNNYTSLVDSLSSYSNRTFFNIGGFEVEAKPEQRVNNIGITQQAGGEWVQFFLKTKRPEKIINFEEIRKMFNTIAMVESTDYVISEGNLYLNRSNLNEYNQMYSLLVDNLDVVNAEIINFKVLPIDEDPSVKFPPLSPGGKMQVVGDWVQVIYSPRNSNIEVDFLPILEGFKDQEFVENEDYSFTTNPLNIYINRKERGNYSVMVEVIREKAEECNIKVDSFTRVQEPFEPEPKNEPKPLQQKPDLWIMISLVPVNTKKRINMFDIPEKLEKAGFANGKDFKLQSGVLYGNINSSDFQKLMNKLDEWLAKQMFGFGRIDFGFENLPLRERYVSTEAQNLFKFPFPMQKNEEIVRRYFSNRCLTDLLVNGFDVFYSGGNIYYKTKNPDEIEAIIAKYDNDLTNALVDPNLRSELVKKIVKKEDVEEIEIVTSKVAKKSLEDFFSKKDSPFSKFNIPDDIMTNLSIVLNQEEDERVGVFEDGAFSSLSDGTKLKWVRETLEEYQIVSGYDTNFTSLASSGVSGWVKGPYVGLFDVLAKSSAAFKYFSEMSKKYGLNVGTQENYRKFYGSGETDLCYDFLVGNNGSDVLKLDMLLTEAYFALVRPEISLRNTEKAYEVITSFVMYLYFNILSQVSEQSIYTDKNGEDEKNRKKRENLKKYLIRSRIVAEKKDEIIQIAKNVIKDPIAFLERYPTIEKLEQSQFYRDVSREMFKRIEDAIESPKNNFELDLENFWSNKSLSENKKKVDLGSSSNESLIQYVNFNNVKKLEIEGVVDKYLPGSEIIVGPTAKGSRKQYDAANWITKPTKVKLMSSSSSADSSILRVMLGDGKMVNIYGFNILGYALNDDEIMKISSGGRNRISAIIRIREITRWGVPQAKQYYEKVIERPSNPNVLDEQSIPPSENENLLPKNVRPKLNKSGNKYYPSGSKVVVVRTPDKLRENYPVANWISDNIIVKLNEDVEIAKFPIVKRIVNANIKNVRRISIYDFNIVSFALNDDSLINMIKNAVPEATIIDLIREVTTWDLDQATEYYNDLVKI